MKIQHHMSQGVRLTIGDNGQDAWVDVPFGPDVHVNFVLLAAELAPYNLELMDPDEEEPEMLGDFNRILCLPAYAEGMQDDGTMLAAIIPMPVIYEVESVDVCSSNFPFAEKIHAESAWV